jgi:hypothetical protein
MSRLRGVLLSVAVVAGVAVNPTTRGFPPSPEGPPSRARDETAARVSRLIARLGSDDFAEREAATRELEAVGAPALAALREVAAKTEDEEVRRRAGELVGRIENRLDALALEYQELDLPLPPAGAPLVQYAFVHSPDTPLLGFLLRPETAKRGPVFLVGSEELVSSLPVRFKTVNPSSLARGELRELARGAPPEEWDRIALAVECKARGWEDLAAMIFEQVPSKPPEVPPRKVLLRAAWDYWERRLRKPDTDWRPIRKQLRTLTRNDSDLDTEDHRRLLVSLDLALVPSKARPGSVEAMIDDLVQARNPLAEGEAPATDPRILRLLEAGFPAVPHLIDHLGDNRLTRFYWVPGGITGFRSPAYFYRVADHVGDVLGGVSAGAVGRGSTRDEVEDWWREARKVGEEAYYLRHALPDDDRRLSPDETALRILRKKYPRQVPTVYRTLLETRPKLESWSLAEVVAQGALPRREKVDLFARAARHELLKHRRPALWELSRLDPVRFADLLVETLDDLPEQTGEMIGRSTEESFASLVCQTSDRRAWEALERAARRAAVALRLQYLQRVAESHSAGSETRLRARLRFLAAFLDDATVREFKPDVRRDTTFAAAEDFPRLEVRDYAAMSAADLLELKVQPRPVWTEAEWARLREQVRTAMREKR